MSKAVQALADALRKNPGPWLPDDVISLAELRERADRMEGRTTPPWRSPPESPGIPLSELMGQFTDNGRAKLLAEVTAHPIYKRLTRQVPRLLIMPAESPFDPLRCVQTIAEHLVRPYPLKRQRTSGRPDKKRAAELKAIQRLQRVTRSPERKRILAEWIARDMERLPVALGKIAHPAIWWLAYDLWLDADTADRKLLLEAAQLVDPAGFDDKQASRYVRQVQKILPKRPRTVSPKPIVPPMTGLFGLGGFLAPKT